MHRIPLRNFFSGDIVIAAGATLGIDHFNQILATLPQSTSATENIIALDFDRIEDATPSYVKATVLALHQCGRRHAGVLTADEQQELGDSIVPLNIVVVILNASPAVRDCIHEVFSRRGVAMLTGGDLEGDQLVTAELLGEIEPAVLETLLISSQFQEFQAADLIGHAAGSNIKVTGWNNRLAELHRHRLVRRRTEGRTHRFIPLARKVEAYGEILSRK